MNLLWVLTHWVFPERSEAAAGVSVYNSPLCWLTTAWFSRWALESPPASSWSSSCPDTSWRTWHSDNKTPQVTHHWQRSRRGDLTVSLYRRLFCVLTSSPCRPSCSRTPRRSRPCRWSDARWSRSWSAEDGQKERTDLNRQEPQNNLFKQSQVWKLSGTVRLDGFIGYRWLDQYIAGCCFFLRILSFYFANWIVCFRRYGGLNQPNK